MGAKMTGLIGGIAAAAVALAAAGCDGNLPATAPDRSAGSLLDASSGGDAARGQGETGPAPEGGPLPDLAPPAPDQGVSHPDAAQPEAGAAQPEAAPGVSDAGPQTDAGGTVSDTWPQPDAGWTAADAGLQTDGWVTSPGPFGAPCGKGKPPCAGGLICVGPQGGTTGFCTKVCAKLGVLCPGASPGHRAVCAINSPGHGLYCAFVCYSRTMFGLPKTYPCPKQMKCDPKGKLPATGQYYCY